MGTKWDALFGKEYYIEITNEERRYLGLDPVMDEWDTTQFYSKTNLWHKRTTVFWEGNIIKKVIVEQKRVVSPDNRITYHSIQEDDTNLSTENREWLLPLTNRGKKKKVTATNILAVTPLGCTFHFHLDMHEGISTSMSIYNDRNNQRIATGEHEKINKIRNDADFHQFMKYYMESCPEDYFEHMERLKYSKHITVKYETGDIFRVEVDRFHYCYGLITGQIRKIQKWKELPQSHSLQSLMMVPIMVRYYDVKTTNLDLSAEELVRYPLGRVTICGDNDIIWGTHTIVGHKELNEDDIEFNLVCYRIKNPSQDLPVHVYDMFVSDGMAEYPESFHLYVEWGTAVTILPFDRISEKLQEYLKEYRSPHGGVSVGIYPELIREDSFEYKGNLLNDINKEMRMELFSCLGLKADAAFDEFAAMFGGLTKKEILAKKCKRNALCK